MARVNPSLFVCFLKTILLSDSSSDEDEEKPVTENELQSMLKLHRYQRKHQMQFYQDPEVISDTHLLFS